MFRVMGSNNIRGVTLAEGASISKASGRMQPTKAQPLGRVLYSITRRGNQAWKQLVLDDTPAMVVGAYAIQ